MRFNCEICGKDSYIRPSHFSRVKRHFCSRVCRGKAHLGKGNPGWKENERECVFCKVKFKPKNKASKFCSQKCMGLEDTRKNRVSLNCIMCKTSFTTILAKKDSQTTCSLKCKNKLHSQRMKLDGNPTWLGGKSFEPYLPEFNETLKSLIKKRDLFICRLCGLGDEMNFCGNGYSLSIHHIDYDKHNNEKGNLISLCNPCHAKTNYNREVWKKILLDLLKE